MDVLVDVAEVLETGTDKSPVPLRQIDPMPRMQYQRKVSRTRSSSVHTRLPLHALHLRIGRDAETAQAVDEPG